MYLSELKEEEKGKFLELVYKMANCDHSYSTDEIRLINRYKGELGMTKIPVTGTIEDLIAYFAKSSAQTKQIVLFEVYGVMLADDEVTDTEAAMFEKLKAALALPAEKVDSIVKIAEKLEDVYKEVHAAVF